MMRHRDVTIQSLPDNVCRTRFWGFFLFHHEAADPSPPNALPEHFPQLTSLELSFLDPNLGEEVIPYRLCNLLGARNGNHVRVRLPSISHLCHAGLLMITQASM